MPKRTVSDSRLDKVVGSRIKASRQARGWNQVQLSVALGIQPETVSRYETGDVPVSLAVLFRIAGTLNVGVDTLLNIPSSQLSVDEVALVNEWRQTDGRGQKLLLEMLRWGRRGKARQAR